MTVHPSGATVEDRGSLRFPVTYVRAIWGVCAVFLALALAEAAGVLSMSAVASNLSFYGRSAIEWSSFCLGVLAGYLGFLHYTLRRQAIAPVFGLVVFMVGLTDIAVTITAESLIRSGGNPSTIYPFAWTLARLLNLFIVIGSIALTSRLPEQDIRKRCLATLGLSLPLVICGTFAFHQLGVSGSVPRLAIDGWGIPRPHELIPVLLTFVVLRQFRQLYQKYPSRLTHGLIIAVVPAMTMQLAASLLNSSASALPITTAHLAKLIAYLTVLVGTTLDFTGAHVELQRMNRQLASSEARASQSEERFALAVRGTSDGIWDWVVGTDTVWYSDRYQQLLGYGPHELEPSRRVGQRLVHPDDRARVELAMRHHLDGDEAYDIEYRLRCGDGEYRWFRARGASIQGRDGEPARMAGSITDISREKAAEQQLERALEDAKRATEAKSVFLANMSHEIRTPLTAILGYAENLLDPKISETERHNGLRTINENGRYLLQIINDVLDLAKIEAGKLDIETVDCDPYQLAQDVADLLRPRAVRKGLEFHTVFPERLPATIHTDPVRLKQVVINLMGNAIKFTQAGSVSIEVQVNEVGEDPVFDVTVRDTGIGMTLEQCQRIFQPFTQADDSTTRIYGGTGLGLSVSVHLAGLLGGEIGVESTPGRGSAFTISVPPGDLNGIEFLTLEQREARRSMLNGSMAVLPRIPYRILLAEDNRVNQRLVSHILSKNGAEVTTADNGAQALSFATQALSADRPFDLVIMDMQMPVLDGYAATRALRENDYPGPILALTANAMASDRRACLEAGCDEFATKPVDREDLLGRIDLLVRTKCPWWVEAPENRKTS